MSEDTDTNEQLLEANRRFAQAYSKGDLSPVPRRHLAIVTCMDARMHPVQFLGLDVGDAHVIRNAGGRISDDVIRSLIVSSLLLDTHEFWVIHHTECGMLTHTNAEIRKKLREETGVDSTSMDFLPFTDLEDSVREDVHKLKNSPYFRKGVAVHGFIYDVRTGETHRVS